MLTIDAKAAESIATPENQNLQISSGLSEQQARKLELFSSKRPRLFLDAERIKTLKSKLNTSPYKNFWQYVQKKADQFSQITPLSPGSDGNQEPLRRIGHRLPFMGMAYLMTRDEAYVRSITQWMDYLSALSDWPGTDLDEAHALAGMAIVYDWLYDRFSTDARARYEITINRHALSIYQDLRSQKAWWATEYLQNHNYVNAMALGLAGLTLAGKHNAAGSYIEAANKNFLKVFSLLSPDGASHEGVHYWAYGTQALLTYSMAASPIFGLEAVRSNPFFRKAAHFRLYTSLPGYEEIANFADSPRKEFYHAGATLRVLASLFQDGLAQWLAGRIDQAKEDDARLSWLDMLWYDPSIMATPPDDLPTYGYFDNLGILIRRSSWRDDAAWVFFKAGPPMGKLALANKRVFTGSHIHPDAGSFSMWANGEWLVLDDGYVWDKRTENHSVLLVNGKGQIGEGGRWFDNNAASKQSATAEITGRELTTGSQILRADLTRMYPHVSGLESWHRTIAMLPAGYLIVHDEVRGSESTVFESLLHIKRGAIEKTINSFSLQLRNNGLLVDDVSELSATRNIENYIVQDSANLLDLPVLPRFLIRLHPISISNSSGIWTNTLILRPFNPDQKPGSLQTQWMQKGTVLEFSDNQLNAKIDFQTMKVTVQQLSSD